VQHHAQATTLTNKTSPMPIMAPLNKPINFNVLKPNALPYLTLMKALELFMFNN
jgi:hypothetical protein